MLFTFPLRYWFTIGVRGVFSLTRWCWQIQAGFLRSRPTQDTARFNQCTPTGLSPAMVQLSRRFSLMIDSKCGPTTLCPDKSGQSLGSSHFARHYSGNHCYFLFLRLLRCFSSAGWLSFECYAFSVTGCPIRKPADITLVCSSPQLIAAYHVLHRLSNPRHSPCALNCFKKFEIVVMLPPLFD